MLKGAKGIRTRRYRVNIETRKIIVSALLAGIIIFAGCKLPGDDGGGDPGDNQIYLYTTIARGSKILKVKDSVKKSDTDLVLWAE